MQRGRTAVSRRITWAPGWRLRVVLLATVLGSAGGLVFGLSGLNRPLLNGAVFYLLGGAGAAVVAGLVVLLVRGDRDAPSAAPRRRDRGGRRPRP